MKNQVNYPPKQWQNSFWPHTLKLSSGFKAGQQRSAAQCLRGHKKHIISQWIAPLEDMDISLFEISLIRSLKTLPPLHSTLKVSPTGCRFTKLPGTSGLYYFPSRSPCNKTVQQYSIVEYRTTGTFPAHQEGFLLIPWSMGPCPGFSWDRVNFLFSSWYSAVFWI